MPSDAKITMWHQMLKHCRWVSAPSIVPSPTNGDECPHPNAGERPTLKMCEKTLMINIPNSKYIAGKIHDPRQMNVGAPFK